MPRVERREDDGARSADQEGLLLRRLGGARMRDSLVGAALRQNGGRPVGASHIVRVVEAHQHLRARVAQHLVAAPRAGAVAVLRRDTRFE